MALARFRLLVLPPVARREPCVNAAHSLGCNLSNPPIDRRKAAKTRLVQRLRRRPLVESFVPRRGAAQLTFSVFVSAKDDVYFAYSVRCAAIQYLNGVI